MEKIVVEKTNPHTGHRKRLRQQALTNGIDSMHEHQVLELMLSYLLPQKDTNPIAHNLIEKFGGFANVFEADISSLQKVSGVGDCVASFIHHFRDFYYYYQKKRVNHTKVISNTESAIQYILPILGNKHVEEVYIVCVDPRNRVVKSECFARGDEIEALVNVRSISKFLTDNKVYNFFIAHNHPEGDPHPSAEDDKLTKALLVTARVNGIKMFDHVIVGKEGVYSYFVDGKIEKYRDDADKLLGIQAVKVSQNYAEYEGRI